MPNCTSLEDLFGKIIHDTALWTALKDARNDRAALEGVVTQAGCSLPAADIERLQNALRSNTLTVDLEALVSHLQSQPEGWSGATIIDDSSGQ